MARSDRTFPVICRGVMETGLPHLLEPHRWASFRPHDHGFGMERRRVGSMRLSDRHAGRPVLGLSVWNEEMLSC